MIIDKSLKGIEASRFNIEDYKSDILAKNLTFSLLYKLGAKKVIIDTGEEVRSSYYKDIECDLNKKHLIISVERRGIWLDGCKDFPRSSVNILNRKSKECNSKNQFTTFVVCSHDLQGLCVIKYDIFDKIEPIQIKTRRGDDWVRQIPVDQCVFYRMTNRLENIWQIKENGIWRTL